MPPDMPSASAVPVLHSATPAPLSERTALAVLGSMLFLIVTLTILLAQATWVDSASAAEVPAAADGGSLAQR